MALRTIADVIHADSTLIKIKQTSQFYNFAGFIIAKLLGKDSGARRQILMQDYPLSGPSWVLHSKIAFLRPQSNRASKIFGKTC